MILSNIVFMMRELLQILSVGSEYIGDLWSWFEIGCIVLSLTTASAWLDEVNMRVKYIITLFVSPSSISSSVEKNTNAILYRYML